jgi:hypothetical protein
VGNGTTKVTGFQEGVFPHPVHNSRSINFDAAKRGHVAESWLRAIALVRAIFPESTPKRFFGCRSVRRLPSVALCEGDNLDNNAFSCNEMDISIFILIIDPVET